MTSILDWTYAQTKTSAAAAYEKGKVSRWDPDRDIDWNTEIDLGRPLPPSIGADSFPFHRLGASVWDQFRWELQAWMVSQFLHGEQGALVAAARLVETLPGIDAKSFAATQVMDEAKHVEVFARYLSVSGQNRYQVDDGMRSLLVQVVQEREWDLTILGMQIIVEGLALAAFRFAESAFHDRLVVQIAGLVARDEARHVAFGVSTLRDAYRCASTAERAVREELALDAIHLIENRFCLKEVWQVLGVDVAAGVAYASRDPLMVQFRRVAYLKIGSCLAHVGLMTPKLRHTLDGFSGR